MNDRIEIDDINAHMDLFYVLSGAVEFTMREDPIHRVINQNSDRSDRSLITESVSSYDSKASMVKSKSKVMKTTNSDKEK